jgi:hypothetical protein
MSKLIVSIFTERYNYPFLCLDLLLYSNMSPPNSQYNKSVVFKLRGHFTPKCRSPPFLFSKNKAENLKRRITQWLKNITFM